MIQEFPTESDRQKLSEVLRPLSGWHVRHDRLTTTQTVLGRGGYGVVRLAILDAASSSPSLVAVKELIRDGSKRLPFTVASRLAREMRIWADMDHPNIIKFRGYYLCPNLEEAYLRSPYAPLGSISKYVKTACPSELEGLKLALDSAKGLQYLHNCRPSVCHGDIKAENVLVQVDGTAALCDFGLATAVDREATGLTSSESDCFKGSIRWASIELFNGSQRTRCSDMWAFGCFIVEVFVEEIPYAAMREFMQVIAAIVRNESPEPKDTHRIPPLVLEDIRRCWRLLPSERPSVEVLRRTLEIVYERTEAESTPMQSDSENTRSSPRTSLAEEAALSSYFVGNKDPPSFMATHEAREEANLTPNRRQVERADNASGTSAPSDSEADGPDDIPGEISVGTENSVLSGTQTLRRDSTATPRRSLSRAESHSSYRRSSVGSRISEKGVAGSQMLATNAVDRAKPPVTMLPPHPPMPPPTVIRTKNIAVGPPRPASAPPPELNLGLSGPAFSRRSTTPPPLQAPTVERRYIRQNRSSLPHDAQGLRQTMPPSTSSFRSSSKHASVPHTSPAGASDAPITNRKYNSTTSLPSGGSSAMHSRRPSVSSSWSSDLQTPTVQPRTLSRHSMPTNTTPAPWANDVVLEEDSVDGDIVRAIRQIVAGGFLYKYTRRVLGKGYNTKRHIRFFWVHPFSNTLYWSSADPGSAGASGSTAKSACIKAVNAILDPNPFLPGVYQYSIVLSTPQREMKLTAPTKERHDVWFSALKYVLDNPSTIAVNFTEPAYYPQPAPRTRHRKFSTPNSANFMSSPRSLRSIRSSQFSGTTARAMRSQTQLSAQGSVGKQAGTRDLGWINEVEKGLTKTFRSPSQGPRDRADGGDLEHVETGRDESFELFDEWFEDMENVRTSHEGESDPGTLSQRPHRPVHQHHHHHQASTTSRLQTSTEQASSPSAWSFRSKLGSTPGEAKRSIPFTNRGKSPTAKPSLNFPRRNN